MKDSFKAAELSIKQDSLSLTAQSKSLARCSSREAREIIDYDQALQLMALPLSISIRNGQKIVRFAVAEGTELNQKRELQFATGLSVQTNSVNRDILQAAIEKAYKTDDIWLGQNIEKLKEIDLPLAPQILEDSSEKEPVPNAIRVILEYAIVREASDIHLIPYADGLHLKLRIKGELLSYKEAVCDLSVASRMLSRIKVLSGLRSDLKAVPQDGSFSLKLNKTIRQIRISSMPTVHGEKCVMRITSRAQEFKLETLGISADTESIIRQTLALKNGLILVCGSTGSGKTTTLYAFVQELVKLNLNVVSIEDPVESQLEGISQTCLDLQRGLDYPTALKSLLRQDPDVILVGEIRDSKSAELVIAAALSGHLVLSTLHSGSVRECLTRMQGFGCNKSALTSALKLVINQSLVQKLCESCKIIDLTLSNLHNFKIYKAVGCAECDYSGFDSRLLVIERAFLNSSERFNQIISASPEILENPQIYESKLTYLESYLKQGLILPI